MKTDRLVKGFTALVIGCALNFIGDRLLGVNIELFLGLDTFSFTWIVDMFVLPFFVGLAVAIIFGMGGKWLCYFPPLIVRAVSYYLLAHAASLPPDSSLIPMGWWGFFVILTMEAAAFGGIMGEIMIKGTYGRSAPETVYKKGRAVADDEGDS
jgi:hypothetical protein